MRTTGIDFGTTNSSVAVADREGTVTLARLTGSDGLAETFRSILYFERVDGDRAALAGQEAIERYLASDGSGRLIQSLKSYLADRGFMSTSVRSIFEMRFGAEKVSAGGEMVSVASGLALRGRDLD